MENELLLLKKYSQSILSSELLKTWSIESQQGQVNFDPRLIEISQNNARVAQNLWRKLHNTHSINSNGLKIANAGVGSLGIEGIAMASDLPNSKIMAFDKRLYTADTKILKNLILKQRTVKEADSILSRSHFGYSSFLCDGLPDFVDYSIKNDLPFIATLCECKEHIERAVKFCDHKSIKLVDAGVGHGYKLFALTNLKLPADGSFSLLNASEDRQLNSGLDIKACH
jgi:hypothetical protein